MIADALRPALADGIVVRRREPGEAQSDLRRLEASPACRRTWRADERTSVGYTPLVGAAANSEATLAAGLWVAEDDTDGISGRAAALEIRRRALTDRDAAGMGSGDLGFVAMDAEHVVAVRSAAGTVPLYVLQRPDVLAVATRLELVVAFVDHEIAWDTYALAVWMSGGGRAPWNRSVLSGVQLCPRGTATCLQLGRGSRSTTYWDPRPATPDALERGPHLALELRTALMRALDRGLADDRPNLLTLSGGVDSSALAALAGGLDRPVHTLSLLPGAGPRRRHEERFVDLAAAAAHAERRYKVDLVVERSREIITGAGPLSLLPTTHQALESLPPLVREHPVAVLFGGELADQVCGSMFTYADWAAHAPLWPVLRGATLVGRSDVVRWAKGRARDLRGRRRPLAPRELAEWIDDRHREEHADWLAEERRQMAADRRPLAGLAQQTDSDLWLAMNWAVLAPLGIRRLAPFASRSVIELAFRAHPDQLVGPGTKRLLHDALHEDVPAELLFRPDKGYWGPQAEPRVPWTASMDAFPGLVKPDLLGEADGMIGLTTEVACRRLLRSDQARSHWSPGGSGVD